MRINKPIEVTFRNGAVVRTLVDQYNLSTYLGNLDMDQVAGIRYGSDVAPTPPVDVLKPSDIDIQTSRDGNFFVNVHKDDKRIAVAKYTPLQFNDFGLRIMQQAHYEFRELQGRLDGLDK